MSLAFLYNVASCIAYALAIAAYGSLYYVERKPGYIFTALIFFAYTIDIVFPTVNQCRDEGVLI